MKTWTANIIYNGGTKEQVTTCTKDDATIVEAGEQIMEWVRKNRKGKIVSTRSKMLTPLAKMIDNGIRTRSNSPNLRQLQSRLEIASVNVKGRSVFSDEYRELRNAINACKRARIHTGFIVRCLLA